MIMMSLNEQFVEKKNRKILSNQGIKKLVVDFKNFSFVQEACTHTYAQHQFPIFSRTLPLFFAMYFIPSHVVIPIIFFPFFS